MGRGRLTGWVGGVAAMTVAVLACRQLVGIGNGPPQGQVSQSTDSGAEGGFTYGQGACETCVTTSCDAQATKCAGNPSCSALEECMSGCGTDPTCRAQCSVDHGLGNDGVTPVFEACLASSCADACGLSCGSAAALFPPAAAPGCQGCIVQKTCAYVSSCLVDPACQAALRCQLSSETPDALQACPALGLDAGAPAMNPSDYAPVAGECSSACSWGADWSCVGNVDWPSGTLGPVEVTATVLDGNMGTPIDGALVKICNIADTTCAQGLDMKTTDDAGIVTLTRPSTPVAVPTYLDISSPTTIPTKLLDYAPSSEPRFAVAAIVPTWGALESQAAGLGVTLDPNLGIVTVAAVDCRLAVAAGVQLDINPKTSSTRRLYFADGVPSLTATATDSGGLAVFINVPVLPTTYTVTATPLALGRVSSTIPFFVQDGGYANFEALPTP